MGQQLLLLQHVHLLRTFLTHRPCCACQAKIKLHMVSCYINLVAAGSYAMLWTGFSPIVPDVGSCL